MEVYIKDYQAAKRCNEEELEGTRGWNCRTVVETNDLYIDEEGIIRVRCASECSYCGNRHEVGISCDDADRHQWGFDK